VKWLSLSAKLKDGNDLRGKDRRLRLFAVRCSDEMVGGLSFED
jgi:hypothetical protein